MFGVRLKNSVWHRVTGLAAVLVASAPGLITNLQAAGYHVPGAWGASIGVLTTVVAYLTSSPFDQVADK